MIQRRPDWQRRLDLYLAEVRGTQFSYGTLDCALFTAGAVLAMTGEDPAASFRGYRTAAGGQRVLRRRGLWRASDLADRFLPPIPPQSAAAGDVGEIATPDGPALCIVQGPHLYVMMAGGLALLSRDRLCRAWRVPA